MNRHDVVALFPRQHWVASGRQLAALGVTSSALDRAVQRGVVVRHPPGRVRPASTHLDLDGSALALQRAPASGPS
jgi:hypothetical protein